MSDDVENDDEPRIRKVWRPSSSIGLRVPTDEDLSLADKVAALPPERRGEVLKDLDMGNLQWDHTFWARPSQLAAINSDKWLTLAVSGRGWGKTWFLAQAMHKKAVENPGCRIALVGRSTSDVRDILIQGESGVLNVVHPDQRPKYRPSVRRLVWPNGSEAMTFTADIPDQLRGVQFHYAFGDELGSWRVKATGGGMANAWSQLQIATRLGDNPQIFIATTPRRVPMIIDAIRMAEDEPDRVLLVRGSTYANRHLGKTYKDTVTGLYAGTSLGNQELEGELLSDVAGALLSQDVLDTFRRDHLPSDFWMSELPKRVVGVDPTVSQTPGDECGIVVVGTTAESKLYRRRGYVLEDASILGAPDVWAKRVVEMARKYRCPVVAEDNQGGAMVRMVIQAEDPSVAVTLVKSRAGKFARAEPVAQAYQQGRVHHTDYFTELEDQLTTWAPDEGMKSPDRLDACLVRGTLVKMADHSEKPIEKILPGDYVLTRQGAKKVIRAEITNVSAEVKAVVSSDGRSLVGTGNHPVWSSTRNDFVRLDALLHDTMVTCSTESSPLRSRTAEWFTDEILNHHRELIEFTMELREALDVACFTEIFTQTLMALSQSSECKCTTSTEIRSIMTCPILLRSLLSSMQKNTQKSQLNPGAQTWQKTLLRQQRDGTKLQKVEKVIVEMPRKAGKPQSTVNTHASFVERFGSLERLSLDHVLSAIPPADRGTQKQINHTKIERVPSAARVSMLESIYQDKSVHIDVKVFADGVLNVSGLHEVWNLEVEDAHEYFANGILVHNCVHAITSLMITPPKDWVGTVSVIAPKGRHLELVRDHAPDNKVLPRGLVGRGRDAAIHRLDSLQGFNANDLREKVDESEKEELRQLKKINRAPRLSVGSQARRDPFGAPTIRKRL